MLGNKIPKRKTNQMNWEAIKYIYKLVLVYSNKVEYLGGDRYKIISFYPTGEKQREIKYQNEQLHGKDISWRKNKQKYWEAEYQNGYLHGKYAGWHENGSKSWEGNYQNGYLHGKYTGWYEDGNKWWESEYQNGKQIK